MSAPETISFPTTLDDENTFMGFPEDSQSFTLASAIGASDTTCTVSEDTSGVNLPYLARFASGEFLWVTAKNDSTKELTVARGENGSTAATHDAGEALYFGLSAPQYSQLIRGIENLQETLGVDVNSTGSGAGTVAGRISDIEGDMSTAQGDISDIEDTLGTSPEGGFASIAARLDDIDDTLGTSPEGGYSDVADRLDGIEEANDQLHAAIGSNLTISSGAITVGTDGWYTVLGEGSADDTLVTISGGASGNMVVLQAGAQNILIDHAAGNILLSSQVDKVLSYEGMSSIVLAYNGTNWVEIASNVQMMVIGLFVDGAGSALATTNTSPEWPWTPPFYLMGIYSSTDASGDGEADILYGSVGAAPATVLTAWDHSSEQFKNDTTLSGLTREFGSQSWRLAITGDFDTATWLSVALWGWRR